MSTLLKHAESELGYLYRYQLKSDESIIPNFPNVSLKLITLPIIKITPKGFWIDEFSYNVKTGYKNKRWVSNDGLRRYAHQTKSDALNSFIKRSEKRVKILEFQLMGAKMGLSDACKKLEVELLNEIK